MKREELLKILQEHLTWYGEPFRGDSGQERLKEVLTNSLLIPKPKFQLGDVVKTENGDIFTVDLMENLDTDGGWIYQFYDPSDKVWRYLAFEDGEWCFYDVDDLELVEARRDD